MDEEKSLTEQESLALITSMINKAKCDYEDTGVSALMWGTIVIFCSLATFTGYYQDWPWVGYIWFLTLIAIIPQIIIAVRESKRKRVRSYNDSAVSGIWISFGIAIGLFSFFVSYFQIQHAECAYMIFYGIPTFSTGLANQFRPMIYGGIGCWVFALISMHVPFPFTMLLTAGAAIVAWFIPGLILRKRYRSLKNDHV
jgi:hypothetical protein